MSAIEWTDETWNPVVGCTPVSPGCLNCYAATMAGTRLVKRPEYVGLTVRKGGAKGQRGRGTKGRMVFNGTVRMLEERLTEPFRWKKPRLVFVNSMSDLFHEDVPFEFIDRVFAVMALTPRHTYQVLTKRPERMAEYLDASRSESMRPGRVLRHAYTMVKDLPGSRIAAEYAKLHVAYHADYARSRFWPLPNVWLGTSVEDQARADERIPHLLKCPAAVRFLSVEPLIGAVDLSAFMGGAYVGLPGDVVHPSYNFGIGWVIVGGESGANARPCDVGWIESIVEQCRDARVPVFVKQLGRRVFMGVDDWYAFTNGDTTGTGRFVLIEGDDRGHWYPDSRKGGDPSEWPQHLRVRQWPAGYAALTS